MNPHQDRKKTSPIGILSICALENITPSSTRFDHVHAILACFNLQRYPKNISALPLKKTHRNLRTWPPWVIWAPAFNHKTGNAAHSGVSEVLFFTNLTSGRNNGERNGLLEGYSARQCAFEDLQPCTNFKIADRRIRSQQKLLLLHVAWQCSNPFAESIVTCLRNKAHVYLLT